MHSLIDSSIHGGLCDGPVGKADGLPYHEAHSLCVQWLEVGIQQPVGSGALQGKATSYLGI